MANTSSAVEELHDVSVLHNIFFAFATEPAFFARFCIRPRFQQLVPRYHFRANEFVLEISVDNGARFWCRRSPLYRPRSALLFASRQERDEIEQPIAGLDEVVHAVVGNTELATKIGTFIVVDIRKLLLNTCVHHHGALPCRIKKCLQLSPAFTVLCVDVQCTTFLVQHIQHGLHRKKLQGTRSQKLVRRKRYRACCFSCLKRWYYFP